MSALAPATSTADTRVFTFGLGSWLLPERCTIKVDQRVGLAWIRSSQSVWVLDDMSATEATGDDRAALLEGWATL